MWIDLRLQSAHLCTGGSLSQLMLLDELASIGIFPFQTFSLNREFQCDSPRELQLPAHVGTSALSRPERDPRSLGAGYVKLLNGVRSLFRADAYPIRPDFPTDDIGNTSFEFVE